MDRYLSEDGYFFSDSLEAYIKKGLDMRIILVLLFCSVLMIGCSENLGEEFTIRGEITSIDPENKQIFIGGTPVIVKNIEDFKVGEILEAKLRSKSSNDYYNPKDIEIISLIKIEQQ